MSEERDRIRELESQLALANRDWLIEHAKVVELEERIRKALVIVKELGGLINDQKAESV